MELRQRLKGFDRRNGLNFPYQGEDSNTTSPRQKTTTARTQKLHGAIGDSVERISLELPVARKLMAPPSKKRRDPHICQTLTSKSYSLSPYLPILLLLLLLLLQEGV